MKGIGFERDCARRFRRSLMVPSRRDGAACRTSHASLTEHGAIVPGVWWYELRNSLVMNERRGRLSSADTAATPADLRQLRILIDQAHDEDFLVALAREHHLSVSRFLDDRYRSRPVVRPLASQRCPLGSPVACRSAEATRSHARAAASARGIGIYLQNLLGTQFQLECLRGN